MFRLIEIVIHGKSKWELVYTIGGKHVAYFNDYGEAKAVLQLVNK